MTLPALPALRSSSVLLLLLLAMAVAGSIYDDEPAQLGESNTACALSVAPAQHCTAPGQCMVLCEFAMFGRLPAEAVEAGVVKAADGVGCVPMDRAAVAGKFVLADRGECAMTSKALHAQHAGAVGFLCGHSELGADPVRMRHAGDENEFVTVPSVMVSKADAAHLTRKLGQQHPVVLRLVHTDNAIEGHAVETALKDAVFQDFTAANNYNGTLSAEALMRLGEFLAQNEWASDADVVLREATRLGRNNYEIIYAMAEYLWNVRKQGQAGIRVEVSLSNVGLVVVWQEALPLFVRSTKLCLRTLMDANATRAERTRAMDLLKSTVVLVPEDAPQGIAFQALAQARREDELVELMMYVNRKRKIGTGGLTTWAHWVDLIGHHDRLVVWFESFYTTHPMRQNSDWVRSMRRAYEKAKELCREATDCDADELYSLDVDELLAAKQINDEL